MRYVSFAALRVNTYAVVTLISVDALLLMVCSSVTVPLGLISAVTLYLPGTLGAVSSTTEV